MPAERRRIEAAAPACRWNAYTAASALDLPRDGCPTSCHETLTACAGQLVPRCNHPPPPRSSRVHPCLCGRLPPDTMRIKRDGPCPSPLTSIIPPSPVNHTHTNRHTHAETHAHTHTHTNQHNMALHIHSKMGNHAGGGIDGREAVEKGVEVGEVQGGLQLRKPGSSPRTWLRVARQTCTCYAAQDADLVANAASGALGGAACRTSVSVCMSNITINIYTYSDARTIFLCVLPRGHVLKDSRRHLQNQANDRGRDPWATPSRWRRAMARECLSNSYGRLTGRPHVYATGTAEYGAEELRAETGRNLVAGAGGARNGGTCSVDIRQLRARAAHLRPLLERPCVPG